MQIRVIRVIRVLFWLRLCCVRNKSGKGFDHQYEVKTIKGDKVVIDKASGLMWQQSGSSQSMRYDDAKEYINVLNRGRFSSFAGFDKWRLPTLEEAMSLLEPAEKNNLYINPMFDREQRRIWTADQVQGGSSAWFVYFDDGSCYYSQFYNDCCVRVVRFGQSSQE